MAQVVVVVVVQQTMYLLVMLLKNLECFMILFQKPGGIVNEQGK
jgi:hypothetical protein